MPAARPVDLVEVDAVRLQAQVPMISSVLP
jgi:hypothetical protein